jgi:hypothetical protein
MTDGTCVGSCRAARAGIPRVGVSLEGGCNSRNTHHQALPSLMLPPSLGAGAHASGGCEHGGRSGSIPGKEHPHVPPPRPFPLSVPSVDGCLAVLPARRFQTAIGLLHRLQHQASSTPPPFNRHSQASQFDCDVACPSSDLRSLPTLASKSWIDTRRRAGFLARSTFWTSTGTSVSPLALPGFIRG